MKVYLRLFGTYRKYLPTSAQGSTCNLEVPVGTRIEGLQAQIPIPSDENLVILINGRSPRAGQVLEEGDTIAIFPAMAGGCTFRRD